MKRHIQLFFLLVIQLLHVKSEGQSFASNLIDKFKENKPGTYYSYQEALSNPLAVVHLNVPGYHLIGKEIGCFTNLESIDITWINDCSKLPRELFQLKKLKDISIYCYGDPYPFPKEIQNLTLLEHLRAPSAILPDEASTLSRLKKIAVYSVSEGFEFSSLPDLESIELCVFDSLNLAKIKRATQQAFVSNRKPLRELRLELAKLTAASFRYIVQSLAELPGIESLGMNYDLTDSTEIEVLLPAGSFPDLRKLKVAATTTNQFLFQQCQTIKSLAINGISFSLFDIDRALIKPFDITFGIKNLSSFSISLDGIQYKNLNPLLKTIENQDSLLELHLSGIGLQDVSRLSFDWLSNLKFLKTIAFEECENIPLSSVFYNISSHQNRIKVSILNCIWNTEYIITKGNDRITEFVFWGNVSLPEFLWKMFPNVSEILADSYYYNYHEIETLRSVVIIETDEFPETWDKIEVVKGFTHANFLFIKYPIYKGGDYGPSFPKMSNWEPLITKSAMYYYGDYSWQDTTFDGVRMDVSWYPSGKKKSTISRSENRTFSDFFYESGKQLMAQQSIQLRGKIILLHEIKYNEAGAIVYYMSRSIERQYYSRILFYPDGHIRRIHSIENGKKMPVQKFPPLTKEKRPL